MKDEGIRPPDGKSTGQFGGSPALTVEQRAELELPEGSDQEVERWEAEHGWRISSAPGRYALDLRTP